MPFFSGITDAAGITNYAGEKTARAGANRALGDISGISKKAIDWWETNAAPYQLGLMKRGTELYESATPTDADYQRALREASSGVSGAFGRARETTARGLARYGIPNAGRFAAGMKDLGIEQASSEAAARNQARAQLRDAAFAKQSQALGLQSGLNAPGFGLINTGLGGLSTAASGYGSQAASLEAANQAALSNLIQGAGAVYGGYLAGGKGIAGGGKSVAGANGGEFRGLNGVRRYADGMEVRERYMGNAERAAPGGPSGIRQLRGEMRGPGTPISDSIPVQTEDGEDARLADGEVVMPTDTVAAMGLQFIRQNPEKAAHMLGVKLLEEQIDQTHTPAEEQARSGLSVNPRGLSGYANGGPVRGLRASQEQEKEEEDNPPRPTLGTGLAERGARTIEEARRRREQALKEAMGENYADGGKVRGLRVIQVIRDEDKDEEQQPRPYLGTGLAERGARAIEDARKRREQALREAMGEGYADGGETQSPWAMGLSALGHGLANAYSRGGWLQGLQAGQQERRRQEAELAAQRQARQEQEKQQKLAELAGQYGKSEAGAQPSIIDQMAAQDIDYAGKFARLKGLGGGGTEYGMNPVYTTDEAGNTVAFQLSKSGDPRQVQLPGGMRISRPLSWKNLGDKLVGFDAMTGEPVMEREIKPGPTQTPSYQEAVEKAKTTGRETGQAEATKQKRAIGAENLLSLIGEAKDILPTATGSLAGKGIDVAAGIVGQSTKGAKASARLKVIAGNLVMAQPRMEGPQSDRDTMLYREMAGQVGDDTLPIETRLAALDELERMNKRYAHINKAPDGGQQTPPQASRIASDADYNALQSGAMFIGPDGILRRKP